VSEINAIQLKVSYRPGVPTAGSNSLRWSPETGQVAKRESLPGTAGRPKVRHDQYPEETRPEFKAKVALAAKRSASATDLTGNAELEL